jgi:N-acetylmuramoyl-L-alanine amidase
MYSYHQRPRAQQAASPKSVARRHSATFLVIFVVLIITGILVGFKLFSPEGQTRPSQPEIKLTQPQPTIPAAPTVSLTANPLPTRDPFRPLVGIVSGHKGYDPGAVCPDGLTEAEVNFNTATEVLNLLDRRGVQAVILDEFDDRLTGFTADALVSIHSDSCQFPGLTGFKVARVTDSAIPEAEDRLVTCLNQEYGTYTGLPQNPGTITDNMTDYHAFREIDRKTPGAIIELGFLLEDRFLLENKPKVLARGVAAGILCFLGK